VVQSTPDKNASTKSTNSADSNTILNFFFGLILGLLAFLAFKYRETILSLVTPAKKKEAKDA
jgi:hypothetical protein